MEVRPYRLVIQNLRTVYTVLVRLNEEGKRPDKSTHLLALKIQEEAATLVERTKEKAK